MFTNTYDHAGRLLTAPHKLGDNAAVTIRSNTYDALGRLTASTQGGSFTTNYTYNVRSWLKSITTGTLFSETLCYNEPSYGNTPRYAGDIATMRWKADAKNRVYNFTYDGFSRLTRADYLEDNIVSANYTTTYTYDRMGNMLTLRRSGLHDNGIFGPVDNLSYTYNGNQLVTVTDGSSAPNYSGAFHFSDGADEDVEYEYDQNGNLTKDLNKKITQIQYNLLNLPSMITFNSSSNYKFVYDATGRKLSATFGLEGSIIGPIHSFPHGSSLIDEPMAGLASPLGGGIGGHPVIGDSAYIDPGHGSHWGELLIDQNYQYCGNIFYSNGNVNRIFFDGGYITLNGDTPTYHYYLQDHLGNNRVVVKQDGTIEQVNHYYPFGVLFGESTGGDKNRYKYNGKELDRLNGLNWYDYGARWHDAALGRWATVDPMAEKYYNLSPYNYCGANPVNAMDPNGCDWISAKYGNELFVYYDSRISSQKDIVEHYYNGEERDYYDIQYVGTTGTVYQNTENGPLNYYTLNSDGSFADASGNLMESEVSMEGLLHIGNESMYAMKIHAPNSNWYGTYLGPDNPIKTKGEIKAPYYAIPPKDKLDYAAFLHDKGYDSHNANGFVAATLNPLVYAEDWHLAMRCSNDVLVSKVGTWRHFWGMAAGAFFGRMAIIKYFNGFRMGYETVVE